MNSVPIYDIDNNDDGDDDNDFLNRNEEFGPHNENSILSKNKDLLAKSKELVDKLRSQNLEADAKLLLKAMECVLESGRSYESLNLGREYNFSAQSIINYLKSSQEKLARLIHEDEDKLNKHDDDDHNDHNDHIGDK